MQYLKKNKNQDTSGIKRTKTFQLQNSNILTERSYDILENQDESGGFSKLIPRDSSVIFEQDESIMISQSNLD